MPRYNLTFASSAERDIAGVVEHIAEHGSVPAASRWYRELVETARTLQELPERCSIAEESAFFDHEIRVLIVGFYRVLYRIAGDEVQVLHVRHGARKRFQ